MAPLLSSVKSIDLSTTASNIIGGPSDFCGVLTNISGGILSLVGFLTILMFVWTAILYITSGGSAGQIQKANTVLKYAVIGTAIVLLGRGLIAAVIYIIGGGTGDC